MKTIELLLLDTVGNLGIVGEIVKVKPGYARNYLLPRGLAAPPTPGAVQKLSKRRAEVKAELKTQHDERRALIERLAGYELTLMRSANEQGVLYAGISQHDIAEALRAEQFDVDDQFIRIGGQIKRLDSYDVPIVIAQELRTEIKLWIVSDKPAEKLVDTVLDEEDA
jgi:large subunit ribosomal protein L9